MGDRSSIEKYVGQNQVVAVAGLFVLLLIVVGYFLTMNSTIPTAPARDIPGKTTNPGTVNSSTYYSVQNGVVTIHPVQYLNAADTVDKGAFRMHYTYNDTNYSAVFTMKGIYHHHPITQWGFNQSNPDMKLSTTIDPNDGVANGFLFPPRLVTRNGKSRLEGIVVIDKEFRDAAMNVSIARYGGMVHPFRSTALAPGVYASRYVIPDMNDYFITGNRRIMVGDIKTNLYYRLDDAGIGIYLD